MKNCMKRSGLILLLISVVLCTGCNGGGLIRKRAEPVDTLQQFETAYNSLDIDEMKSCLSKDLREAAEAMFDSGVNLISELVGVDVSSILDLYPLAQDLGLIDEYMQENDISFHLTIEVMNEEVYDDEAFIDANIYFESSQTESLNQECIIYLIYDNKENYWYIDGFDGVE